MAIGRPTMSRSLRSMAFAANRGEKCRLICVIIQHNAGFLVASNLVGHGELAFARAIRIEAQMEDGEGRIRPASVPRGPTNPGPRVGGKDNVFPTVRPRRPARV